MLYDKNRIANERLCSNDRLTHQSNAIENGTKSNLPLLADR